MKKILKSLCLLTCLPVMLTSCNKDKVVGEYVFQMGKSKDTHIGVSLKLKSDLYNPEDSTKGKQFELSVDISSQGENEYAEILSAFNPITGSYLVDNNETVYEAPRLQLTVNILGEIEIPQEFTNLLFVANIDKNMVNFFIPVSINYLTLQLYWYGIDVKAEDLFDPDTGQINTNSTPEGSHPVGTHPTEADIEQINTHYAADHDGKQYRDYHVLKLGLTKQ